MRSRSPPSQTRGRPSAARKSAQSAFFLNLENRAYIALTMRLYIRNRPIAQISFCPIDFFYLNLGRLLTIPYRSPRIPPPKNGGVYGPTRKAYDNYSVRKFAEGRFCVGHHGLHAKPRVLA